jgi:hypothetical protein
MTARPDNLNPDSNRDPLTGAPGSHPAGTAAGAAAGGLAGAAIGTATAGPVGTVVGAAIGAVAGGLTGKGVAEAVNPTAEDAYWRDNYSTASYYDRNRTYDDYAPAYRLGYSSYGRYPSYDVAETELERDWERAKDKSRLSWEQAKHATRDAWHRVERAIPGDFDGDGR